MKIWMPDTWRKGVRTIDLGNVIPVPPKNPNPLKDWKN